MARHVYPFEKLRVWHNARELICNVHAATATFPKAEIYGLISQTNRAASGDLEFLKTFDEEKLREQIESLSRHSTR